MDYGNSFCGCKKKEDAIWKKEAVSQAESVLFLQLPGSAVGLGNIWRFPYLAAQYGGGIFLLVYLILVVSFGFTIMTAEIAIGRKTGLSAIGAFKALNKKYAFIGILATIVPIIILPYYSVIGGWVMKYCAVYITGQHSAAADNNFFSNFTSAQ